MIRQMKVRGASRIDSRPDTASTPLLSKMVGPPRDKKLDESSSWPSLQATTVDSDDDDDGGYVTSKCINGSDASISFLENDSAKEYPTDDASTLGSMSIWTDGSALHVGCSRPRTAPAPAASVSSSTIFDEASGIYTCCSGGPISSVGLSTIYSQASSYYYGIEDSRRRRLGGQEEYVPTPCCQVKEAAPTVPCKAIASKKKLLTLISGLFGCIFSPIGSRKKSSDKANNSPSTMPDCVSI